MSKTELAREKAYHNPLVVRAHRHPWGRDYLVGIYEDPIHRERFGVVREMVLKEQTCDEPIDPVLRMNSEQAQRLMDDLWDCGIRPSTGQGSAGQLAAVQAHLADMQRLVFEGAWRQAQRPEGGEHGV